MFFLYATLLNPVINLFHILTFSRLTFSYFHNLKFKVTKGEHKKEVDRCPQFELVDSSYYLPAIVLELSSFSSLSIIAAVDPVAVLAVFDQVWTFSNKWVTAFFFSNRSSRPRVPLLIKIQFWAITFFPSSPTSGECRSRAVLSTFRRSSSKWWRDICPLWRFSRLIWLKEHVHRKSPKKSYVGRMLDICLHLIRHH